MDLSSVFSKTAKGLEEIATRTYHLPSRTRAMLIMVDGQRTGKQLLALGLSAIEGEQQLAVLLQGGFIEPLGSQSKSDKKRGREEAADEDIRLAKSYIVCTLRELLGANAQPLIADVERTTTADELLRLVGKLRAALAGVTDQKRVRHFLEELDLVLA
ncbi:MAG: hypothetical protein E6Q43_01100 [Dokdonella sp.]|nr:MAG: hypothetical protein E6Q43_01100 [Dokdonella sp.]